MDTVRVLVRETCVQKDGEWTPETYMWYVVTEVAGFAIREGVMRLDKVDGTTHGFPLSNVLQWQNVLPE